MGEADAEAGVEAQADESIPEIRSRKQSPPRIFWDYWWLPGPPVLAVLPFSPRLQPLGLQTGRTNDASYLIISHSLAWRKLLSHANSGPLLHLTS